MREFLLYLLVLPAWSVALRRSGEQATAGAGLWVPLHSAETGQTFYFSPATGQSRVVAPPEAALTSTVFLTSRRHLHLKEDVVNATHNATVAVEQAEETSDVPTLVPREKRHSCMPHCTWHCSQPVCEQDCKPRCKVPKCETRCAKLSASIFTQCKAHCDQPDCAMFCPKDACAGSKSLDCNTPKCVTRCGKPKCALDCGDSLQCSTQCQKPACEWKCRRPKKCPTPKCTMVCEQAPECLSRSVAVPLPDGMESLNSGEAVLKTAKWKVGSWLPCSNQCGSGVRTRKVECNSGVEDDCAMNSKKPRSSESCTEYHGCKYETSSWSKCSSRCSTGTRTRRVECSGARCMGRRPRSEESCEGHDDTCDDCEVTVFGNDNFTAKGSWSLQFGPGEYSAAELEYRGAKCDDVSSIEIVGPLCKMTVFEYGDFNQEHKGWQAEFSEGKHSPKELVAAGAKNNDISSFKVVKEDAPATRTTTEAASEEDVSGPWYDDKPAGRTTRTPRRKSLDDMTDDAEKWQAEVERKHLDKHGNRSGAVVSAATAVMVTLALTLW
mmetsp:Transcript_22796/g.48847  ORF Transcript_22796/g.48847 Transcript_22796/m.48847 type:complete len:551 (+) Transcript_22796:184-1836(+)